MQRPKKGHDKQQVVKQISWRQKGASQRICDQEQMRKEDKLQCRFQKDYKKNIGSMRTNIYITLQRSAFEAIISLKRSGSGIFEPRSVYYIFLGRFSSLRGSIACLQSSKNGYKRRRTKRYMYI